MANVCRWCSGAEGWPTGTIPTQGAGFASAISGTPSVISSDAYSGSQCFEVDPSASADESWNSPTWVGQSVTAVVARIKAVTLDTSSSYQILAAANSGFGNYGSIAVDTSNRFRFQWTNVGLDAVVGPAISTGEWYLVELLVDMHTNPWTARWRINGVEQTAPSSLAVALSTGTNISWGAFSAGNRTVKWRFDDVVAIDGTDQTMWPLGGFNIEGITADQAAAAAHQTITTTQWQYGTVSGSTFTSTGNFTGNNETDSCSRLNDLSIATAIRMNGGTSGQAGNGRWPVADPSGKYATTPRAVAAYVCHQQASAGTSQLIARTLDGASTTDIFNASYTNGTTAGFYSKVMDTKPSGGAWTLVAVQGISFELDSSDTSPAIHIGGFYYEVAFPESPRPARDRMTVAPPIPVWGPSIR